METVQERQQVLLTISHVQYQLHNQKDTYHNHLVTMVTQDRTRITVETLVPLAMLSSIMTIVQMDTRILKELVMLLIADLINKVI